MKTNPKAPVETAELRHRANARLAEREAGSPYDAPASETEVLRLVHELQVHQIELELQNEELLQARAEREAALERYRDLYDFAPIGYLSLGPDGTILAINLAGARLFGLERARLTGARVGRLLAPESRPTFEQFLAQILAGGAHACEGVVRPRNEAPRFLRFTGSGSEQKPESRVVVEDVTERKAAAEQLRMALKMEAVGRLAGGVAHDFNNLLAVILGNTAFALETTGAAEPARADLLEIKAAAEQATAVTRQLLTFSRKNVLDAQVLDLNQVTADLLRMLRRLIGEHIELGHVAAPDLGLVKADAGQIEQALLNLALNARDAMPDDGTLTIETANVDIDPPDLARFEGLSAGRYVRVSVTDTGCGMAPATLERVFEPFFTTKERGRGTGFGLAAVYGIVKQSGGHIGIQSQPGRGTTVEVLLPRLTEATPRVVRRLTPTQPPGGTETILVVEDERAMRALTARILGSAGYSVLTAANGDEALLAANRHGTEIALVLTDVVMPRMNGPALVERIERICQTTKVLYMSGYSDDTLADRGVLPPGVALINKPFTADELMLKVRELLDSQRSRSLAG